MIKKKKETTATPPTVHKATLGNLGRVVKGEMVTEAEAIAERKAGRDVVVCGSGSRANRNLAQKLENAVGPNKRQDRHEKAGPHALPHFQPEPRPPKGHLFYETQGLKAAKKQ